MLVRAGLAFVVVLGLTACLVWAGKALVRQRVHEIVFDTQSLVETGGSGIDGFVKKHGLKLIRCDSDSCGYELTITNRPLSLLHLVQPARFWIRVYTDKKRATIVIYGIDSMARRAPPSYLHVQYDIDSARPYAYIDPWWTEDKDAHNGSLQISGSAPESIRQLGLALNVFCLTSLHGCSNLAKQLPSAWRERSDGSVDCIVPNTTGMIIASAVK